MYNVSERFHAAVLETSPVTQVMFKFADGTILTNEDVHITNGFKIMEAANYEDELTIGSCLSSTLDATFMNYAGLLSGFAFGECEVSLGVKTAVESFKPIVANTTAIYRFGETGEATYTGHSTMPYLRINGVAASEQPSFPIESIVIYEGKAMCIGKEGQTWTESSFSAPVSTGEFMVQKYLSMAKQHLGFDFSGNVMRVFGLYGEIEKYEFARLGVFAIDTPTKRKTNLISVSAYDKMKLFDVSANDFLGGLTYPITIGAMFEALCAEVGVGFLTSAFTNSTHVVNSVSLENQEVTAKEILGWIAEAACSFARMTRDGKVELGWFENVPIKIPETQCFAADVADYSVAVIDKLEILSSETSLNAVIGDGNNSYVIINNPFLKGATAGDVYTYSLPIYTKLRAFPSFRPITATAVCDWSVQAGDILTFEFGNENIALPVYCQTIIWKSDAKVSYESTGGECRPVLDAETRKYYAFEVSAGQAVKQGEAYNDVSITHENGIVTKATISGIPIEVRQNAQDGFAIYANNTYKGGVAVKNGEVVVISNTLTSDADSDCWAIIGEDGTYKGIFIYNSGFSTSVPTAKIMTWESGGAAIETSSGARVGFGTDAGIWFKASGGASSPSLSIGGGGQLRYFDGAAVRLRIDSDGTFIVYGNNSADISLSSNGKIEMSSDGQFYLRDNNGKNRLTFSTSTGGTYLSCGSNTAQHQIGVDNNGPYCVKNGTKTYF